jgi:hypothetical protein
MNRYCIVSPGSGLVGLGFNTSWHLDAGWGAVHSIRSGRSSASYGLWKTWLWPQEPQSDAYLGTLSMAYEPGSTIARVNRHTDT